MSSHRHRCNYNNCRRKSLEDVPKDAILAQLRKVRCFVLKVCAQETKTARRLKNCDREREFLLSLNQYALEKMKTLEIDKEKEIMDIRRETQEEVSNCKHILLSKEYEVKHLQEELAALKQSSSEAYQRFEETILKLQLELKTYKQALDIAVPMLKDLRNALTGKQRKDNNTVGENQKNQSSDASEIRHSVQGRQIGDSSDIIDNNLT